MVKLMTLSKGNYSRVGDENGMKVNQSILHNEYILSNQTRVEITRPEPIKINGEVVGYEQVGTGRFRTVNNGH